jgi:uncharacterized protein YlxW (UPF0749 family)
LQTPGPMPTDFIPLMGMLTGIVTMLVIGFTIVRVAQSQIGQAIARRIHGKGAADPELRDEVHEIRDQVAELQHRLAESEERLDFTERLLTRGRDEAAPHG